MSMKVYLITNLANDKVYVGQTRYDLAQRLRGHINKARRKPNSSALARAINEFGHESFTIELLEDSDCEGDLDMAERFWIRTYNSVYPNGYNLETGGSYFRLHDTGARSKMSRKAKGKVIHPETRSKISESLSGRKKSKDMKERLSKSTAAENNPNSKLTWDQVREIRKLFIEGNDEHSLCKKYGVSITCIKKILAYQSWKNDPVSYFKEKS